MLEEIRTKYNERLRQRHAVLLSQWERMQNNETED